MSVMRTAKDVGRRGGQGRRALPDPVDMIFPRQRGDEVLDTLPLGSVASSADLLSPPQSRGWLVRRGAVVAHVLVTLAAGVAAGWLTGLVPLGTALAVVLVLVGRLPHTLEGPRPEAPRPSAMVHHAALSVAAVALASAAGLLPQGSVVPAALTVAAALVGDVAATLVRRRLSGHTRIVLVGEVDSLALALLRWANRPDVSVVGALEVVQEPETGLPDLQVSLGLADGRPPVARIEGLRDVPQWASVWGAETIVVIPGTGVSAESLQTLGWHLERTPMTLAVAGLFDPVAPHRVSTRRVGSTTLLVARSSRPPLHERLAKAAFDRIVGLVLLTLAAPVIAVLCLAIRLDSPGPSLFRQIRVGRQGRPFEMVKLRTMYVDAESHRDALLAENEGNGVLFKIRRDPRITRVGRLLRTSSLDELPQLINVVRGQMSLVGPRPALPEEVQAYDEHMHRRYVVRPGMTGLWQVNGRSDLGGEESMELDLHYVDNHALAGDLSIMARTVGAVLGSRGAY